MILKLALTGLLAVPLMYLGAVLIGSLTEILTKSGKSQKDEEIE